MKSWCKKKDPVILLCKNKEISELNRAIHINAFWSPFKEPSFIMNIQWLFSFRNNWAPKGWKLYLYLYILFTKTYCSKTNYMEIYSLEQNTWFLLSSCSCSSNNSLYLFTGWMQIYLNIFPCWVCCEQHSEIVRKESDNCSRIHTWDISCTKGCLLPTSLLFPTLKTFKNY